MKDGAGAHRQEYEHVLVLLHARQLVANIGQPSGPQQLADLFGLRCRVSRCRLLPRPQHSLGRQCHGDCLRYAKASWPPRSLLLLLLLRRTLPPGHPPRTRGPPRCPPKGTLPPRPPSCRFTPDSLYSSPLLFSLQSTAAPACSWKPMKADAPSAYEDGYPSEGGNICHPGPDDMI